MTLIAFLRQRWWRVFALISLLTSAIIAQDWQIVDNQTIAPGVFYQALQRQAPPTWVGVVRIPLPLLKELALVTELGGDRGLGRQPVSQIAARTQGQKGYVTAAINGDYFSMIATTYSGDPLGIHVQDRELVSLPTPNRSALVGLRDGRVLITRFRMDTLLQFPDSTTAPLDGLNQPPPQSGWCLYTPIFGATTQTPPGTVEIIAIANLPLRPNTLLTATVQSVVETGNSTIPPNGVVLAATGKETAKAKTLPVGATVQVVINLTPLDASFDPRDVIWAIGGGPRLLRDEKISVECLEEGFPLRFAETKHPRTAVGLKDDALLWVVVDGRQPGYSEGMTLYELADFLLRAGCKDAVNLDGGGSSALFVRGSVVNRPSDGRERPVANALLLLNLFPPQPLMRLWTNVVDGHWLAGSVVPLKVMGEDAVYRLLPLTTDAVTIVLEPSLSGWRWDGDLLLLPRWDNDEPQKVAVQVLAKDQNIAPEKISLCVHPKPVSLIVTPNPISVAPNASVPLRVQAFGRERDGQLVPLRFDPMAVQWQVDGEVGEVRDGTFFAAAIPKQGILQAELNGVTVKVPVRVGEGVWQVLHEFDNWDGMQLQGYPESTKVDGSIVMANKRSGTGALQLRYDFSQGVKTRTASVVLNKLLPAGARRLSLWVYGDGSGCWLRARLRDGTGKIALMDLTDAIRWKGEWREVQAVLPSGLTEPVTLEAIYLVVIRDEHKPQGEVILDCLRVGM